MMFITSSESSQEERSFSMTEQPMIVCQKISKREREDIL